jgi:glycosyltransferase involved in cell wall biosynthesis
MRVCHVTPHLPPDQAANALLPFHLGRWIRESGGEVTYVAHPPRAARTAPRDLPGPVVWIGRTEGSRLARRLRLTSLTAALRIVRAARPMMAAADVVHIHSNGLLAEVGALVARWLRKPVVLTLYGTEIWHYRARTFGPDLFTRAYRGAQAVTFYSRGLRDHAWELGLQRDAGEVVYPPVAPGFTFHDERGRDAARAALGLPHEHVILNVKRLHPLASQRHLIEAMASVTRRFPSAHAIICGTGPARAELEGLAGALNVAKHVTFAGLVDNERVAQLDAAADVFALPSVLEALPTVAVEALASGTPVISTDNPGGLELNGLFGEDVRIVPRQDSPALATALIEFLSRKRRTRAATAGVLDREFSAARVAEKFRRVYEAAMRRR